jgi:hypothetical protein
MLAAGLLLSVGLVLRFVDDLEGLWWLPRCVFHELSGLHCPGCGATRALHALAHGQIMQALWCNALLVALVLALPAWILAGRKLSSRMQVRLAWLIAGAFLAFFLLRNLHLDLAPPA